jgi:hypothetical protein
MWEVALKIDVLNAALLKQSGARAPLRSARNLPVVDKHVCSHRIGEAITIAAVCDRGICLVSTVTDRRYSCQFRTLSGGAQCIADRAMNLFVNYLGRPPERRIAGGDHEGISKVLSMKNYSAACPTANNVALLAVLRHIREFTEVANGESRMVPLIKSNRRDVRHFQKRFVDGHVHCGRSRRFIAINVQRGKKSLCHSERGRSDPPHNGRRIVGQPGKGPGLPLLKTGRRHACPTTARTFTPQSRSESFPRLGKDLKSP